MLRVFRTSTESRLSLSETMRLYRFFSGRRARQVYLALLLLLIVFSTGLRVRSYLLTRKIYAVLSGLRIDTTTEEQLLKTVPYLVLNNNTLPALPGGQRYFRAEVSNFDDLQWMKWAPSFLFSLWPAHSELPVKNKWNCMSLPLKAAYVLGWRHLSFSASVTVLNGTVSSTWYGIEPDVMFSFPLSYFVVARSVHGFSRDGGRRPMPVHSTDDESPEYRFGFVAGRHT